ncbi:MAG TPA: L,D-transpeptidase family protein [Acidimicrobiales bacterium]|nr:L,D-transpeptidase family protein [Acidimicrobiales bacterium]
MRLFVRRPLLVGAAVLVIGAASAAAGLLASHHSRANPKMPKTSSDSLHLTLLVASTTPAAGGQVEPDGDLVVTFSSPLADYSPQPSLSPPVAGAWLPDGSGALEFQSSSGLPPGATETLDIPGGNHGVVATDGAHLPSATSLSFTVAPMSMLRTQELLATLGYLPLTFTPQSSSPPPTAQMALDEPGTFSWKWTMPSSFSSLWTQGQSNVITSGAVMAFEAQHGLATDGVAGPQVWNALLSAVAQGQTDSNPDYDWADVSTTVPESVTVWRNGSPLYTTVANTGIESAPTEVGTWPVYARYTSTTMSGTNPDGTHYDDPGVPWVSYFHGGDALHGFVRSSYGYPQSLGCVEMPPADAAVVYPLTPLGTLVTIEPEGTVNATTSSATTTSTSPPTSTSTTTTTTSTTIPSTTSTTE